MQDVRRGLGGKIIWNGAEVATLPSLDSDSVHLQLPSLHSGHHSIFAQLMCDDSCPHPVNGSVFFAATAAPATPVPRTNDSANHPAVLTDADAALLLDEDSLHVACTAADVNAFLPAARRRK